MENNATATKDSSSVAFQPSEEEDVAAPRQLQSYLLNFPYLSSVFTCFEGLDTKPEDLKYTLEILNIIQRINDQKWCSLPVKNGVRENLRNSRIWSDRECVKVRVDEGRSEGEE